MWKLLTLSVVQSILLSGGQVLLKFAMNAMNKFEWTWQWWKDLLTNWWFLGCGICYGAGTVLWFYIIKNYPFSMAYPMISLSYVFGMLAAIFIFHEAVPLSRWIGVFLIMSGCVFIAK